MNLKEKAIKIFGAVFFALGVLAVVSSYNSIGFSGIFWFSNLALLFVGAGMILKKPWLIASQMNIVFIPYLFWNIDFFYVLINSESLWGITDYFFTERSFVLQVITLEHIFIIPVAVAFLFMYKPKKFDFWKFSIAQVLMVFAILRIIGDEKSNINCVYRTCSPINFSFIPYEISWVAGYIAIILVTNLALAFILRKL